MAPFKMKGLTPLRQNKEEQQYKEPSVKEQAKLRKNNPFCSICGGNKQSHDSKVKSGSVKPHGYLEEGGTYTDIDGKKIKVPPQ